MESNGISWNLMDYSIFDTLSIYNIYVYCMSMIRFYILEESK